MIPEDNLKISLGKLKTSYVPFSLGKPIDPIKPIDSKCLA